jgi:hypothetical protein
MEVLGAVVLCSFLFAVAWFVFLRRANQPPAEGVRRSAETEQREPVERRNQR